MTNQNHTAFPSDADIHTEGGLTKREYFAALALQGLLSNPHLAMNPFSQGEGYYEKKSVEIADAIIIELNKINC